MNFEMETKLIKHWVTEAVREQYADVELTFTFVPVLTVFTRVECKREQSLEIVVNYKELPDSLSRQEDGMAAHLVARYIAQRVLDQLVKAEWSPTKVVSGQVGHPDHKA